MSPSRDEHEMGSLREEERAALAAWIGERPGTVLAIHALRSGCGRVWVAGHMSGPAAVMVESALVPSEPQGFGDPDALLGLLDRAEGWGCVELEASLADAVSAGFTQKWGALRRVIDVVHTLDHPAPELSHPLVRLLEVSDLADLEAVPPDLLPARPVTIPAVEGQRVFGAVDGARIVGQGGSLAAGEFYADIGVHVAEEFRGQGIATAAAAMACRAVQGAGLTPVWGAGSENVASLRVAAKLGFVEVERLTYLVRPAA